MTLINLARVGVAAIALALTASCGIYKKYETPTSSVLTRQYAEARQQPLDSAAFGNLLWEKVFTDPKLAALIN
ncbi:MAG: TolC family protein, partial [Muribaculaceae bacterium]|nr:TolC family protein [Muribaculaceae bacterium]